MQQRVFRGQHTQRFVITPRDRNNAGIHSQLTVQETIQKVINCNCNERILLTVRLCVNLKMARTIDSMDLFRGRTIILVSCKQ